MVLAAGYFYYHFPRPPCIPVLSSLRGVEVGIVWDSPFSARLGAVLTRVCKGVCAPLPEVTDRGRRGSRIESGTALCKALLPRACGAALLTGETPAGGDFPGWCWKWSLALGGGQVSWGRVVQFAVETAPQDPRACPLAPGPAPRAAVGEASTHPRSVCPRCVEVCVRVSSFRMGRPVRSTQVHRQPIKQQPYVRLSKERRSETRGGLRPLPAEARAPVPPVRRPGSGAPPCSPNTARPARRPAPMQPCLCCLSPL